MACCKSLPPVEVWLNYFLCDSSWWWPLLIFCTPPIAAVRPGGMHTVFGGAGSLCPAGWLQRSHLGPPGCSLRPRILASGAAEHCLFWTVLPAPAKRPQRIHTAALGLSLWYRVCFLYSRSSSLALKIVIVHSESMSGIKSSSSWNYIWMWLSSTHLTTCDWILTAASHSGAIEMRTDFFLKPHFSKTALRKKTC